MLLKPGFHMSGIFQTIGNLAVSRLSQILPTNENSKSVISPIVWMDGDKSGESGAFQFSPRVPDFCDGRRSFPSNENSNLYCRGRLRWISQSPKLLGSSPPITNKHGVSWESGKTSGDYPIYRQNLGWLTKSKICDCQGFSRHMKTRLKHWPPPRLRPRILLTPSSNYFS